MSHTQSKAIARNWQMILSDFAEEAESSAHTVQRQGKLDVQTLVQALVLGCLDTPDASLSDFAHIAHELGVDVVAESIHERLTARMVMLLAVILDRCLRQRVDIASLPASRLSAFRTLTLVDSTQISLPPALYDCFRGNGSHAKLKVQLAFDYLHGQVQLLDCQAGRTPDQRGVRWDQLIVPGALMLFDLGYFDQDRLQTITQAGAWFVTRCQSQVGLYDVESGAPVDLKALLSTYAGNTFEGVYRLGARAQVRVRLVARRVSDKQAASRRRHAKDKAQRQGKTWTQAYLNWLAWDILVSNLPTTWTAEALFTLYGIRWQIELVFKAWKSRLGVCRFGPWRAERVMCQFYAHLIGAILCHHSVAQARWFGDTGTSLAKAVDVIQHQIASLTGVIRHHWRGIQGWAERLWSALRQHAQQDKRKTKPTTLHILMNWG